VIKRDRVPGIEKQAGVTMSVLSALSTSSAPSSSNAVEYELSCSLEELYKGSKRKLKLTRTTLHANGTTRPEEKIITIRVHPGWKQGTTITIHGCGNVEPGKEPADVVVVVVERPHETFTREGHDLIMRKKISLVEALTGCRFVVRTLDGRRLRVDVRNVITVGFEMAIPHEGMPVVEKSGLRGKLRIKFDVEFPASLSDEQKTGLRRLLAA